MDILIKGGTVVTMSDKYGVIKGGDVLVQDDRIVELGKDLRPGAEVECRIDANRHIVIPGFVQSHVHFIQTLFRGLADDLTLLDWLKKRIWPMEAALTKRDVYLSTKLSIAELLLGGTTSVIDFGSVKYQEEIFKAMKEAGIRGKSGKIMMDYSQDSNALVENTSTAINESESLIKQVYGDPLVGYMVTPRFAVTSTEELLVKGKELAHRYNLGIHTHAAENRNEVELVKSHTGMSNIEYFDKLGLLGEDVVIAHGIWLNETEMWKLKETGTNIVHCPSANAKLASGTARISEMNGYGINVALGSDGAPCNNNLDMFNEMRLCALLQKITRLDATSLPAKRVMKMATTAGARAMNNPDIGRLIPGGQADIAVVGLNSPHTMPFTPRHDPYSCLVYSAKASDVTHTIVNGDLKVRDGGLLDVDMESLGKEVEKALIELMERSGIDKNSV